LARPRPAAGQQPTGIKWRRSIILMALATAVAAPSPAVAAAPSQPVAIEAAAAAAAPGSHWRPWQRLTQVQVPGDSIATPARSSETPGSVAIGATTTVATTTTAAAATASAGAVAAALVSEEQSWRFH